jgi:hypothetical protein
MAGASAAAVALAVPILTGSIGSAPDHPAARTKVTEAQTATQVLRLAADHVALTPALPARPDQFVFSESVAIVQELKQGGWSLVTPQQTLVREWRSVGGAAAGLTQDRPVDRPDVSWHSERIPVCRPGQDAAHACTSGPSISTGLPNDGNLMYEFLNRSTSDDISTAYAALIGDDDLAFERAARTLYLGRPLPAVQAAVFAAMNRIPGVTVRVGATDVTGRHGVALAHRGPLGTTELIFDATTYRYLGMNLTIGLTGRTATARVFSARVMTRQAVQRVAIVDNVGDLP